MSEYQGTNATAVDRREETVTTQQPGYATTERVTRDVAAERRSLLFQVTRIIWSLLAVLEISLGVRFLLKLIAANADSGFAALTYGLTELFVWPFAGLVPTWSSGAMVLEVTTLIAMMIYVLLAWLAVRALIIMTDRPSSRTMTRSTSENIPGGPGNVRTTRTTSRD
jgi:YggT family protein